MKEGEAQQLPPAQFPLFTKVLTFPATGGTQDVFVLGRTSCTVHEAPPAPGCTLAGVTPTTTDVNAPEVFPVFVTNTCVPRGQPSTLNIHGTIVLAEPATPAVVVATPRFTG